MKRVVERVEALEAINESQRPELCHELSKALTDRSPTVRGLAVELIGNNTFRELLTEVLPFVNDRDSEVRKLAIECIAAIAGEDFPVRIVAERLFDKDELVRVAAAEALTELGDDSALDFLHNALDDNSPLVRSFVAEAIGSINNKKSTEVLERYLEKEKDERAQLGFYIGLSKLDGRDVLPNLIDLFQTDDYRVRSAVVNSLDQIKPEDGGDKICSFLKKALTTEPTIAARSSIKNALDAFCK